MEHGSDTWAKRALKPQQIWAIRFMLDREKRCEIAPSSTWRSTASCAVATWCESGLAIWERRSRSEPGDRHSEKTKRPVQFELIEPTRGSLLAWLERRGGSLEEFAFPSRVDHSDHLSTRQYARLVDEWVSGIGVTFS